ncbi:MAG: hypothetical protein QM217_04650 [Bacillota bacterium]|jgi:hypothetical protein|nr:hypothetical protein [Bacillota bacterium]
MKQIKIMVYSKRKIKRNLIIILFSSIGIYLLMTLYFYNHFFFNTEINGINVSLRAHKELASIISDYINNYELLLIERNGEKETIKGHDIEMRYNKTTTLSKLIRLKPFFFLVITGSLLNRFLLACLNMSIKTQMAIIIILMEGRNYDDALLLFVLSFLFDVVD